MLQKEDRPYRYSLEAKIVETSQQIRHLSEHDCYLDESVQSFLLAWHNLVEYYENYTDAEISVRTVSEYLENVDKFWRLTNSSQGDPNCREFMVESLDELTSGMKSILATTRR